MDPPWWFWLIPAFLIFISSLVALDARKNRIPTTGDDYGFTTGAFVWFLGCLFFGMALGSYLYRRSCVLRWRKQRLAWDEGTNCCGDYVVEKENDRIIIFDRSRKYSGLIALWVVCLLFCGILGMSLLASAIIDWLQGG